MRKWLVEIREERGLTKEEAANKSDIERSYYNMIERGKRRPSVEVAQKIGFALHFDWTYFFEDDVTERHVHVTDKSNGREEN
ncbi:helix-turn-helix transcriptional regulator [Enterococcus sp.]|uniref:helix-turn-helix transcriptional regulator n=1 Tax=Enterococcus sp. TaxID=35783 RepID=UPI0028A24391|nr:helix-turn-helix transcriptional regulator [Enterococcus sp.]